MKLQSGLSAVITGGASACAVVVLPETLSRRARIELRGPGGRLLAFWPPPAE